MRLLENLFGYIWSGRGNNCNTYIFSHALRGDRPHVLIDPGQTVSEIGEPCLDILLGAMSKDGLKPEDIGLIINTHGHYDHFGATQALVERSRTKPGKPAQTLSTIYEGEQDYLNLVKEYMAKMPGQKPIPFEPTFYLKEGELHLGTDGSKVNLQVIHTPGHTPGSISIYWPDQKVLFTGDLLFYGGVGRTDFGGSGKQLKQSIERISELDIHLLLPGHSTELGAVIKGENNIKQNFASIKLNYFPVL
jgi:glyoxylase-like metal-dependent hydrolase (beta-lactamase superfamily II)